MRPADQGAVLVDGAPVAHQERAGRGLGIPEQALRQDPQLDGGQRPHGASHAVGLHGEEGEVPPAAQAAPLPAGHAPGMAGMDPRREVVGPGQQLSVVVLAHALGEASPNGLATATA